MKGFKIISIFICTLTIISALVLTSNAHVWGDNPFTDVKSNHWYHDAVKYTYEKGIFAGNNAEGDLFAPNVPMTRAMFVTVLYRLSGTDEAYTGKTVFTDVPTNQWYAKAVQWANEKNYVAGMTETTFNPNGKITRSQMARILSLYAADVDGYDITEVRQSAFDKFADADKVQAWAKEGITWMSATGLINGMGTEKGAPILNPNGNATRAQAAQILMSYMEYYNGEYPVGSLTLGSSDISEFSIICGTTTFNRNYTEDCTEIAEFLNKHFKAALGIELPVYRDTDHPYVEGAREILIGRTNREGSVVTVDREGLDKYAFLYEMQGDHLILAPTEELYGSYYSATMFLEDILGVRYYGEGLATYTNIKAASIDNGTRVTENGGFEYASNFQPGGFDHFLGGFDEGALFTNPSHNLPALACIDPACPGASDPLSYDHHNVHYLVQNPCLTDPVIIDKIIENVRAILAKSLGDNKDDHVYIWLNQDDSATYCKCAHCSEVYRVWGRSAPYVQILTYVSEAIGDEYPNLRFASFSYRHTASAPKSAAEVSDSAYQGFLAKYGDQKYVPAKDITPPDNCVVMVKTDDTACSSHPRNDTSCSRNKEYLKRFEGWCNTFDNVSLLNFMDGNVSPHTPFPNIYEIWADFNFISAYPEVTWIRTYGGLSGESSDFVEMKTYLVSKLDRDPHMTWDEYSALVDDYLKAAYGDGWTYIREYIDTLEKLSDKNHWWTYEAKVNHWNDILTEEQWRSGSYEYLNDLIDSALKLAHTEAEKRAVRTIGLQMKYIECQLAYTDGLDSFSALCSAFAEELTALGYKVPLNMSDTRNPDEWIYQ